MKIHQALLVQDAVSSSTTAGDARKKAFHTQGAKFLRELAKTLNFATGSFDVRSNKGGSAVSGEVTLHGEHLYVQLAQYVGRRGIGVLFRTCKGRKDYTGGTNNMVDMCDLSEPKKMQAFLDQCRMLLGRFAGYDIERTFSKWPASESVGELYDRDPEFVDAVREAIPDFEYPDHAHQTVGEFIAHANRVSRVRH